MNKIFIFVVRLELVLAVAVLVGSTGCVGWVGGGGGYGEVVVAPEPDVYLFGGGYDRGHDVRGYSHRGAESHAAAHPAGGGHGGGKR
jgi:hypothetical protein